MSSGSSNDRAYRPAGPIVLAAPSTSWPTDFAHEASAIRSVLGGELLALHHIGSTAIPGIVAKPVIDILAVVSSVHLLDVSTPRLLSLGYIARGEFGIVGRRYFPKTTSAGVRTHQIHAFAEESLEIARHLDFRDYLRVHPREAQEYAALKKSLAARCDTNIETYADGKTSFIREVERRARVWRQSLLGVHR